MNNSAEIYGTRMERRPFDKTAFKHYFGAKWLKVILKLQTHIHDKNMSLFSAAVVKLKISRLTLSQKKIVIEFMIKYD